MDKKKWAMTEEDVNKHKRVQLIKWSNSSIWPIDETLTDAKSLAQRGPEFDDNEGVLPHLTDLPEQYLTIRCRFVFYPGHQRQWGYLSRNAVSVF